MVNSSVVGSYLVDYEVSDAQGNTAKTTREVIVKDTKRPGIFLKDRRIVDKEEIPLQIGSVFLDEVYAQDECNGQLPIGKIAGYNGVVNTLKRATYEVTYHSEDPSGNKADEDGYIVNYRVDDYISPEVSLNTADTVVHDVNQVYSSQQVSVYDNYYTVKDISISKQGLVNPYKLGVYSEAYTAIDGSGNVGTKTRYVKVVDRQAPRIITTAVNLCVGSSFWAMSDVIVSDNYYSEDVLLPLVKIVNQNVNVWKAGLYFINYQVTDPSGNISEVVLRPVFVQYPPDCDNSITSGTVDLKSENAVKVYPNPSKGEFTVDVRTGGSGTCSIEVVNLLGETVVSRSMELNGFMSTSIDMSNRSGGIYFVKVSNAGQTVTKRLVISK
jgi:hypothetical protein